MLTHRMKVRRHLVEASLSTMWVPGIRVRVKGLAFSTLTHSAISSAPK